MIKLLKYLKKYRTFSVLAPLFKMAEAVFELFVPLVIADIIDRGIDKENQAVIWQDGLILALLAVLGLGFAVLAQYFAAYAASGFAAGVRQALFEKIERLPASESDRIGTNRLITMLSGDVNQVQTGVNMVLRLFMRSPVVVFGAVIMAFVTDRRGEASTGWIFVALVPLLALAVFTVMAFSIKMYKGARNSAEKLTGKVRENLTGARVFRSFAREDSQVKELGAHNKKVNDTAVRSGAVSALTGPLTLLIVNAGIVLLLYFGALKVESGSLSKGQLVALYNYMSQILIELVKLANLIVTVTKSWACGDRISAVLSVNGELEKAESVYFSDRSDKYVFENVGVCYPNGTRALSGISFSLKEGQSLGIIGGTGAGKTTVVHLLTRFYDATEGTVYFEGKDIRSYDEKLVRAKIGLVPQKAELFRSTVRENLLWGNGKATDEELWQALTQAQAAETVRGKEKGLDEPVEQMGKNFSGGQRQRLTIARALVRKPEVLILDDSASALDYATEAALRHAIRTLPYHPTLVVVSQRTSSVMHLDRILVLDNGTAVGYGTHEQLLENCAVYREIYSSQFQ